MFSEIRLVLFVLVFHFLIGMLEPYAQAQSIPRHGISTSKDGDGNDRSRPKLSKENYLEQLKQGKSLTNLLGQAILSRPIDPVTYPLGPGDVLQLTLRGEIDLVYPLTIMPEGTISIPTIGVVNLTGDNLNSAREKVQTALAQSYRGVTFSLDLVQLRQFRVYVTGEIYQPGTYFAQAQDRVSDIIELAGGFASWADLRHVEVRHSDSTATFLDLHDFYRSGRFQENIFLRSGDLVHVSTIGPDKDYVIVESNWEGFNIYPIREGDSLLAFIQNNPTFARNIDFNNIRVVRSGEVLLQSFLSNDTHRANIELKRGDRIHLSPVLDKVFVEGAVLRAGPQSYFPNIKAMEYASNAGLTSLSGSLDRIMVVREKTGKVETGRNVIVERGDHVIIPSSKRQIFKDYFEIITSAASLIVSFAVVQSLNK